MKILFVFCGLMYIQTLAFGQNMGNAQAREVVTDQSGNIWILGTDFGLYQFKNNVWIQHPSRTKCLSISVSPNGKLYTIGYDNKLYVAQNTKDWAGISPELKAKKLIADAAENRYTIGTNDKIYKQIGKNWQEIAPNGKAKQLIVSAAGRLYHIGQNNKVYVLEANNWQEIPCPKAKQIALDTNNKLWLIGLDNRLYYPAGRSFNWVEYPEKPKAKAIALSPQGLPIFVEYWTNKVIKGKVLVR